MAKKSLEGIVPLLIIMLVFGVAVGYYGLPGTTPTGAAGISTSTGNLTVSVATVVACTFSDDALDVDFGVELIPGSTGNNATKNFAANPGNGTNYNITADLLSTTAINITIRGTDLLSGANVIGATNVSWQSNGTRNDSSMIYAAGDIKRLDTSFDIVDKIGFNVTPGETRFWRKWVDIPSLTVGGNYTGNYTLRCTSFAE